MQKYSVNQRSIDMLLHYIEDGEIVIPEIQRPFVWPSKKVRDLMDSLYKGYPIGYIITWRNPDVRSKNGNLSGGKQVIIDGQQRITALMTAILGKDIVDQEYKKKRIKISFNPLEETFETLTPAIAKSTEWIQDIADFFNAESPMRFLREYINLNSHFSEKDIELVEKNLDKLASIKAKDIGIIELDAKLDIEDVTEIFVRINSAGIALEQADFAMSKIASYIPEENSLFGVNLRKFIDYFAHLVREPYFLDDLVKNDHDFAKTDYMQKLSWLKKFNDDLYNPDYKDILRVSFVKEFSRGKISDLVKLLSGQNFKTRDFDIYIQKQSFSKLQQGVIDFVNENHYKKFLLIVKSTGIINNKLINSQNILNFAYTLYLKLRKDGLENSLIEKYTRKWLIISILTERYSGSPESSMDKDIKEIEQKGIQQYIKEIEGTRLSDNYWKIGLVRDLTKASMSNPFLYLFYIAQIKLGIKALFSNSMTIQSLVEIKGDQHHIFPKNYLEKFGFKRIEYNQIANMVYIQQEINVKIGDKPPKVYFNEIKDLIKSGKQTHSLISSEEDLLENMKDNAIPEEIFDMDWSDYEEFLELRRKLMSDIIYTFYKTL